jgi:alkanesulfonate monooxygenase SsuD/methylene tetrahydromethanopterin reductase-like flavin-dependent oxidoreductase (luciferase family)
MRIGVSLAEPSGPDPLSKLREQIQRAADDGISSAWLQNIFGLDALTALAAAGSAVPGIELGTAVVPTYPRHPAVLAQQAMTAAAMLDGRLTLGIGLSHQIVIEGMYGYSFARPARHMREYLAVLLPLLAGEKADFTGETVRANIGLTTPAPGEQADGTILWMTGPATVREHIAPAIRAAASGAGRPDPRIVCILPVCVTSDPDAARERAARVFAIYEQLPSYRAMLDREGAAGVADITLAGDEDTVGSQIARLAEAGVTDFVAGEYARGEDASRTRAFLRSLRPD